MTASPSAFFWIIWSIDLLGLLAALVFYLKAASGNAYYNARFWLLWTAILAGMAGIVWNTPGLMKAGYAAVAWGLAGIPAAILGFYGLFVLVILLSSNGRWN